MPNRRRLTGRKIAALAVDGFEKVELVIPLRALKLAGAKVDVVSLHHGRIREVNLLASARLLNGRTLTSWPGIRDDLVDAGATWLDREVVRDGNLVTRWLPKPSAATAAAGIGLVAAAGLSPKSSLRKKVSS
jgi:putative intracellular protease/amidase